MTGLRGEHFDDVLNGLGLAGYALPYGEVAALVNSADEAVQVSAIEYIRATRNAEYLPIVESKALVHGSRRVALAALIAAKVIKEPVIP